MTLPLCPCTAPLRFATVEWMDFKSVNASRDGASVTTNFSFPMTDRKDAKQCVRGEGGRGLREERGRGQWSAREGKPRGVWV